MKVVSAIKLLCEYCYIVRRGKKLYMRCKAQPRHKRRQGFATLNSGYHHADETMEAQSVKSYDGYSMNTTSVLKQEDSNEDASASQNQVHAQCSHCAKPLIYDMSARIKVKQDYLDMIEEEKEI